MSACAETDNDEFLECELLVDGHHGIYVPQFFMQAYGDEWGIEGENKDILLAGPDHEFYWDAWDDVLNTSHGKNGHIWHLSQDGDLFAVVYKPEE